MSCQVCGRVGRCITCCCVSRDHLGYLPPHITECRTCHHAIPKRTR